MLTRIVDEAVAAGELRTDLDVDRATTLCLGLIQGLLHRSHFEPDYRPVEDFDALFAMVQDGIGRDAR